MSLPTRVRSDASVHTMDFWGVVWAVKVADRMMAKRRNAVLFMRIVVNNTNLR